MFCTGMNEPTYSVSVQIPYHLTYPLICLGVNVFLYCGLKAGHIHLLSFYIVVFTCSADFSKATLVELKLIATPKVTAVVSHELCKDGLHDTVSSQE